MSLSSFLFGEKERKENVYDPQQMQLLQRIMQGAQQGPQSQQTYQSGSDWINRMLSGDAGAFDDFAAPYMNQFNQETIPGLAERFAGTGAGAQSSSAFQNALGGAGSNLLTNLAGLRGNLQAQILPQALNYAQAPYDNLNALGGTALQRSSFQHRQGSPGFLSQILGAIGGGFAGPFGGAAGGALGGAMSNWFGGGSSRNASPSLGSGG